MQPEHEHPLPGWAIVVVPVGAAVQSSHPGLTQTQAYEVMLALITDYRRELKITKPLVVE